MSCMRTDHRPQSTVHSPTFARKALCLLRQVRPELKVTYLSKVGSRTPRHSFRLPRIHLQSQDQERSFHSFPQQQVCSSISGLLINFGGEAEASYSSRLYYSRDGQHEIPSIHYYCIHSNHLECIVYSKFTSSYLTRSTHAGCPVPN